MNKAELVMALADRAGISKAQAAQALDALIEVFGRTLKRGEKITVVGFGVFSVRKRVARQGRNPKTGAPVKIPAAKTPVFKAGKALKDAIK
ncbi:MAG: HU family DNA-binding protein [Pseudomonadota bacterium]